MSTFAALPPDVKADLWACLSLRHAEGIGARRAKKLVELFGSAFEAVKAGMRSPEAWSRAEAVPMRAARAFAAEKWRTKAGEEWQAIQKSGCAFVTFADPAYPEPLREIPDAPLLLYYKGDMRLLHGPAVGVVGARRCTREGVAVSAFFSRDLSRAGVTVISGMAEGIDRAAHLAGLEGPGRSIAVLGTGIDGIYPACNADLAKALARDGLLVSEFPPGTPAAPKNFPVRNRLISGLTQGVLVVEAAGRSGSLITARLALEQGRDVFAVPGHTMASVSEGCRELIRRGAKAVFSADDILGELAPLLTLEARKALERRRAEVPNNAVQARDPAKEPHRAALASSSAVLPVGGLPWLAPRPEERPAPASTSGTGRTKKAKGRKTGGDAVVHKEKKNAAVWKTREITLEDAAKAEAQSALAPEERAVMAALSAETRHIDELARGLGMDISRLSGLLAVLEVRGLVRRAPGMFYTLP